MEFDIFCLFNHLCTLALLSTHPSNGLQQHLDLPDLDELQDPHGGEKVLPGLLAAGVLQQRLRIIVHLFRIENKQLNMHEWIYFWNKVFLLNLVRKL